MRSMFELSAKAYCTDHSSAGLTAIDAHGNDRKLKNVLDDVYNHMTTLPNGSRDQATQRLLHGAHVELTKPAGLLSITSMNNLVHNPTSSVPVGDICIVFGNIFPLLEEMNK